MKIAIFGASGFLGTELFKSLSCNHQVIGTSKEKINGLYIVDSNNYSDVISFLLKHSPQIIIDTIGLTNSVECEQNPDLAEKLNYQTAKNISKASKEINAKMIFISSSYVFDGKKGDYSEEDYPNPQGIYAQTKLGAEKEILRNGNNIILRVDLLYGYNGNKSPNGLLDKILSNEKMFIGNPDQIRSPLFIEDVSGAIEKLCSLNKTGIFHLAGPDKIKMIDFLIRLENLVRHDSQISLIENAELLVPEKKDSSLNINKITDIGIKTRGLIESLNIIKDKLIF